MSPREALRIGEREVLARELSRNRSAGFIGVLLGRHHSAIPREINRNGGRDGYRAVDAQRRYDENRARLKERKLETSARLHDAVNGGLRQKWSPKQISRRLCQDHPDDESMRVSHETIYGCLCLQARGAVDAAQAGFAQGADVAGDPVPARRLARDDPGHGQHQRASEGGR